MDACRAFPEATLELGVPELMSCRAMPSPGHKVSDHVTISDHITHWQWLQERAPIWLLKKLGIFDNIMHSFRIYIYSEAQEKLSGRTRALSTARQAIGGYNFVLDADELTSLGPFASSLLDV